MLKKWDDGREFERGQVFYADLESEPQDSKKPSRILNGTHRVVVLFSSTFPRNTVAVVPVSSLYEIDGTKKETISSDVELVAETYKSESDQYNKTIKKDSFIMTNQIRSVTRSRLRDQLGEVLPKDMIKLDLQLIHTLSLGDTIQQIIETEVEKRLVAQGYLEA